MQKKLFLNKRHPVNIIIVVGIVGFSCFLTAKDNIANGIFIEKNGLNLFYYSLIWGNALLNVLFPILPALLIKERASKKMNVFRNALISSIEMIIPFLLFLIICFLLNNSSISFYSESIYSSVLGNSWIGTIAAFIINVLILSFSLSLLGSVVYQEKTYWHILIPLISYNINFFNPISFISSWLPMYCYDIVSIKRPLINHIISIFLIIAISVILYFRKKKKSNSLTAV